MVTVYNNSIYNCDCGCGLQFIKYTIGFQLYLKNDTNNLISINQNKVLNYDLSQYQIMIQNLNRNDFIALLIQNQHIDPVWLHLYNEYIDLVNYDDIPHDSIITS